MDMTSTSHSPHDGTVFVLVVSYTASLSAIDAAMPGHRRFLDEHFAAGEFLASGPQVPRTGGVIIARAVSRAAIDQLIATDPFTRDGLATYEVHAFDPTRGPLRAPPRQPRDRNHEPAVRTGGRAARDHPGGTPSAEVRGAAQFARLMGRQGITPMELRAISLHVSVYAGFPRALNALTVIDRVLAEAGAPAPPSLRRVLLGDHGTTVAQAGTAGPPVVLVHALGLDWHMWEPVMAGLAAGRRVYTYDVRGHGSATEAPRPSCMDDLATDLFEVMDALGLDCAHVVGLSYGGGIVQTAATLAPARFASMTLIATTNVAFDAFENRARSIEQDGMPAQVAPSLTRWFTPEALAVDGWGVRYARDCVLSGDPEHVAAAWRAFQTIDVRGKLAGFSAPTLVLAGERDASTTPEVMSRVASDIPGALYEEMPGTPHMPTLEQPHLVVNALDEFLPRLGEIAEKN